MAENATNSSSKPFNFAIKYIRNIFDWLKMNQCYDWSNEIHFFMVCYTETQQSYQSSSSKPKL